MNGKSKIKIVLVLFFLLITIQMFFKQFFYGQSSSVYVDLSKQTKKESVAGFLHLNDIDALNEQIKILKPKYWRLGNYLFSYKQRREIITGLTKREIIPIVVLSDLCIYKTINEESGSGERIQPFLDSKNYLKFIEKIYKENGNTVIYDIWNEPDTNFWSGSKEQFFSAFKMAHDKIRSLPGGENAKILGPGTSRFDKQYLEDFLFFCRQNKIKLDIIAWHEGGVLNEAKNMGNNINYARNNWLNNFYDLQIKDIFIPEILWETEQFNPLAVYAYLDTVEKNNAKGACKTCWDLSPELGGNTCFNNSMDGIITPKKELRSVWWSYKLYADSLDKRLVSSSSDENIITSAYISQSFDLIIVLGNVTKLQTRMVNLTIDNVNVNKIKFSSLKLYEIPDNGPTALKSPKLIKQKKIYIKDNKIRVQIEDLMPSKLYYVSINSK